MTGEQLPYLTEVEVDTEYSQVAEDLPLAICNLQASRPATQALRTLLSPNTPIWLEAIFSWGPPSCGRQTRPSSRLATR